jgi:hypothetical protein
LLNLIVWLIARAGRRLYPPHTPEALSNLHDLIIKAPIATHYKHSLLFYLLKDLSPSVHDENELAATFALRVHLEKKFWTFVEGLWALDHLQCETAVNNLTHPSIIPTFPDEILHVLLLQTKGSIDPEGRSGSVLPLAYFQCAGPPLEKQNVREEFVRYMSDRNVTETFYWIRTRPGHEQKHLLELLVKEILDGHEWGRNDNVYSREEKATEFVSLPLSEEEEQWVEKYLTEGSGRNYKGAWDTVEMRRIATGRLGDALTGTTPKRRRVGQMDWDILRDGVKRGLGPREGEEGTFSV